MTRAEDLRIVKLYSISGLNSDDSGINVDLVYSKATPFFVLVKKCLGSYKIIPTSKFKTDAKIVFHPSTLHSLAIDKTRKNNRYRKPVHLCPALAKKVFSKEELIKFAEEIEKINCELPTAQAEVLLKKVCMQTAIQLQSNDEFVR